MKQGVAAIDSETKAIQKVIQVGYKDWRQVAGYYDGDGGEEIKIGRYVLRFAITWTDTYLPQLQHIERFLVSEKLRPSKLRLGTSALGRRPWHLSLWEKGGMLEACEKMLPYLDKKRIQVETVLDYMNGRITADETIHTFNLEHEKGKWAGKVRSLDMPWTRNEALRFAHTPDILKLRPGLRRILVSEAEGSGPSGTSNVTPD